MVSEALTEKERMARMLTAIRPARRKLGSGVRSVPAPWEESKVVERPITNFTFG